MTTIRDVAKRLNLSITTVSRALDGYRDVAEGTRQLVIRTAHEMGYTPNRAARQLRRQRADTIGCILPVQGQQFADPFFTEFTAGLGDEAALCNYDLIVSSAPPNTEAEMVLYERWVQGHKVDGVVLNRIRLHDWRVMYLARMKLPFVSMERSHDQVDFVGVEANSYHGIIEMVKYLISRGHSRIAFVGAWPELKIHHDRFTGYQHGLAAHDIIVDPALVVCGDLTSEGGYRAAMGLLALSNPPTAVMCINDLTAIGVMHAAHERGLEVGRDIAVAGFDGIAESAHARPPLTTVNQPVYDMARQLVRMLLALIRGETLSESQVVIKSELLIRESTG
jgi:LacI family transcriptional regulator